MDAYSLETRALRKSSRRTAGRHANPNRFPCAHRSKKSWPRRANLSESGSACHYRSDAIQTCRNRIKHLDEVSLSRITKVLEVECITEMYSYRGRLVILALTVE